MMHRMRFSLFFAVVLGSQVAWSWGTATHKSLNQNSVRDLPPTMSQLAAQQAYLTNHAGDADTRKNSDPTEGPKHFIDLEEFSDYQHLPADLSVVIAQYGAATVTANGTLPWTIVATVDSLAAQFRRADWTKAYQTAADLGHYVGDAHQPLHCTVNYDGKLTGNDGIHSRYESTMMGQVLSTITLHTDSVIYVGDVYALALSIALHSQTYADSIMQADNAAKLASGWSGGTYSQQYYTTLWEKTGGYTQQFLQDAMRDIASLWYTAWVKATSTSVPGVAPEVPPAFVLAQNYPNPFNPTTDIRYQTSNIGYVKLAVYDLLGREVAVLADGPIAAGEHRVTFEAGNLPTGAYYCRMIVTGNGHAFTETKKMMLVR
jgi:hypothetical protein